jgi:hypothetical protein
MCHLFLEGMDKFPHEFTIEDSSYGNLLQLVLQVRAECQCHSCRCAIDTTEFHKSTTGKFLRSTG